MKTTIRKRSTTLSPRSRAALVAAAATLAACTSSTGTAPGGGGTTQCSRDDKLLDAKQACRADDDCPCGAHCALGQCVAECRADDACGTAAYCDRFGRCRPKDDTSPTPPLSPVAGNDATRMIVAPRKIDALAAPHVIRIEAPKNALGPVRVAADDGLEVECIPGAGFAKECRLDGV